MLDQNTDRMWYVIGAVIVGAALILVMNNAFPQLFASVGETFKGKTEQTTEVVDGIMPNTRATGWELFNDIEYRGNTWEYITPVDRPARQAKLDEMGMDTRFAGLAFPLNADKNANASVYFKDVFSKASMDYTFTFDADRLSYYAVDYEVYFGETYVGTVNAGTDSLTHATFMAKSPANLTTENYIKFRTTHGTAQNAFWMSNPTLIEVR